MTTYEIISIIINSLGAVTTTMALIVTLCQTKKVNKKKLKSYFLENIQ